MPEPQVRTSTQPVPAAALRRHRVQSTAGELSCVELGNQAHPTLLLVHGYPDTKEVWSSIWGELASSFHVLAYDVRGAGESPGPAARSGYELPSLVEDAFAVVGALAPSKPIHLVGHDWGSVQGWEIARSPQGQRSVASFTSISGPPLDHVRRWVAQRLSHVSIQSWGALLEQALRSWYIGALLTPGVPELILGKYLAHRWPDIALRLEHVPPGSGFPAPSFVQDAIRGAELYRQNIPPALRQAQPPPVPLKIPVQLLIPRHDRYLSPALYQGLEAWVPQLERREIDSGHWVPKAVPELLIGAIDAFVRRVEQDRG